MATNIISASFDFIQKHILDIILVILLLFCMVIYIVLNNVKFPKSHPVLQKVVVLENLENMDNKKGDKKKDSYFSEMESTVDKEDDKKGDKKKGDKKKDSYFSEMESTVDKEDDKKKGHKKKDHKKKDHSYFSEFEKKTSDLFSDMESMIEKKAKDKTKDSQYICDGGLLARNKMCSVLTTKDGCSIDCCIWAKKKKTKNFSCVGGDKSGATYDAKDYDSYYYKNKRYPKSS